MKRIILILIILNSLYVKAQGWILRTPLKENSEIETTYCTADNTILAFDVATNQNGLYTSFDNGGTWNRRQLNTTIFYDMFMLDDNNGYMITANTLFKTSNRFQSLSSSSLGSSANFREVYFYSAQIGFCGDNTGKLIKTTDGGTTWTPLVTNITSPIKDIYFINSDVGFISTNDGKILRTANQGVTWDLVNNSGTAPLVKILFLNDNVGFVAGSGVVKKTTDGGITWATTAIGVTSCDMKLWNSKLFICGQSGKLYVSADQGETWQISPTPFTLDTYYSMGIQSNRMLLCQEGKLLVSSDLINWTVLLDGINRSKLRSITFADSNRGLVAGSGDYYSVIYSTSDGGAVWKREQIDAGEQHLPPILCGAYE